MTPGVDQTQRRPHRKDKLANSIAESVLRDIKQRGLTQGDQLPKEATMLEEYGVGRGTLREAMRLLETCGLISLKPGPGGGPVVESVRAEDFGRVASLFFQFAEVTYREVVEARMTLEPLAARLAAQRHAGSDAARDVLELTQIGANSIDEEGFLKASSDFHSSVIKLGDNRLVSLVCESLGEIYRARTRGGIFSTTERGNVHAAHVDIAKAVVAGDAVRAEALMAEHMEEYTRQAFERHPALLDEVVVWR